MRFGKFRIGGVRGGDGIGFSDRRIGGGDVGIGECGFGVGQRGFQKDNLGIGSASVNGFQKRRTGIGDGSFSIGGGHIGGVRGGDGIGLGCIGGGRGRLGTGKRRGCIGGGSFSRIDGDLEIGVNIDRRGGDAKIKIAGVVFERRDRQTIQLIGAQRDAAVGDGQLNRRAGIIHVSQRGAIGNIADGDAFQRAVRDIDFIDGGRNIQRNRRIFIARGIQGGHFRRIDGGDHLDSLGEGLAGVGSMTGGQRIIGGLGLGFDRIGGIGCGRGAVFRRLRGGGISFGGGEGRFGIGNRGLQLRNFGFGRGVRTNRRVGVG